MTDKSHLLGFGYAPGNYWFVCQDCGDKHAVGDKRATRCEACAETLYSQVTSVEAVADKHRAMTTVPEEAVKRRIADALEYVWSALDCDVDHIESIIAHMQGNGLYVIEGQNYRRMAEAVQQASAYLALTQPNCAEKIISDLDAALKPEVGIPATELSTASKMEVVGDLQELLERLDAGLEYEGWMETDGAPVELVDIEAAQDLFADAAVAIRALAHADARKVDGDGWEPIESAPKDGTSILAVCLGVHERTGIPFIPEVVEWTQFGWSNEMWGEQPNHGGYYPTHWRPLPSAPSQEVAGSLASSKHSLGNQKSAVYRCGWAVVHLVIAAKKLSAISYRASFWRIRTADTFRTASLLLRPLLPCAWRTQKR